MKNLNYFLLITLFVFLTLKSHSRIGSASYPPCIVEYDPCFNYICNGDFEVYDPILNTLSSNMYFALGAEFTPDPTTGLTDVQSWKRVTQAIPTTPDVFIKNGHGGIPTTAITSSSVMPSAVNTSPTPNNAMAGIVVTEGGQIGSNILTNDWSEGLINDLIMPLQPEYTYTLNFMAYTINKLSLANPILGVPQTTPYQTQYVDIILRQSSGSDTYDIIKAAALPHESVSNGWFQFSFTFTLGKGDTGFDQIEFLGSHVDDAGNTIPFHNYMGRYTFFDEFSLTGSDMIIDEAIFSPCNGNNGAIDLKISNGASPYTYNWTGPSSFNASTQDIQSLAAGTYTVTVTDADNCEAVKTLELPNSTSPVIYVDLNAKGAKSGLNWTDAYTDLQDALQRARDCGGDIWVSEGIYYPTPPGPSGSVSDFFEMVPSTGIYGGFDVADNDILFEDRDWNSNITILSGRSVAGGQTYNVIKNNTVGLGPDAILDGFVIENADSRLSNGPQGAMFNGNDSPTIANCVFKTNTALYGAAMSNLAASPRIINCIFRDNTSDNNAGAMYNNTTSVYAVNCLFYNNNAPAAAALVMVSAQDNYVNCTFTQNSATNWPGAVLASYSINSSMTNCILWNNSCDPDFIEWVSIQSAGSVGSSAGQEITFYNSIVQHTSSLNPNTGVPFLWFTKGVDGGGNLDMDPEFLNASNDFRLSGALSSPAIDAGDNNAVVGITKDLIGNDRRHAGGTVDMGCFENNGSYRLKNTAQLEQNTSLSVFPNPSNGLLQIRGLNNEPFHYKISDINGRLVEQKEGIVGNRLDIRSLNNGIYFLEIQWGSETQTLKILKRN